MAELPQYIADITSPLQIPGYQTGMQSIFAESLSNLIPYTILHRWTRRLQGWVKFPYCRL